MEAPPQAWQTAVQEHLAKVQVDLEDDDPRREPELQPELARWGARPISTIFERVGVTKFKLPEDVDVKWPPDDCRRGQNLRCDLASLGEVLAGIGGFGALVEVPLDRYRRPVLVSGTDGVGTKLRLAFMTG
jgi:hypothetical protein